MRKERNNQCLKKIGRKDGKLNAVISKKHDERIEAMTFQSNERVLSSVSLQIQGMNTTIEKMKDDGDDRYDKMNERATSMEKDVHDGGDESKSWRRIQDTKKRTRSLISTEVNNSGRLSKLRSNVQPSRSHMHSYISLTMMKGTSTSDRRRK